jgi:NAD(P)-dependent dehydrogenase (short-subunit alcohol dehydrogenase family)
MERLKAKVAIVTGGGAGIGRAIASIFAQEGAKVAICGRRETPLQETVRNIKEKGGEAFYAQCDVTKCTEVEAFIRKTVETYGKIDILCNNAGTRASIATILEISDEEWQRTIDVDLKGPYLCSKYVIPEMIRNGGGSIIMISSISAYVGQPKQGAYNAAKGGQELLMKCMALDFAPHNIRVNSICPAWVVTEMNREQLARMKAEPEKVFPPSLRYADVVRLHPIGRLGEPEDVAWAAVYLASDESSWVTGSSIMVDGGYTCQ